jgi:hypothetical protein
VRPRSARRAYAVYLWLEAAEFYCYMLVFTAGALYGIQVAHLDALQLVLVGTALEISALVIAGGPLLGALAVSAGTSAAMLTVAAFIAPSLLLYWRTIRLHGRDVIDDDDRADAP